MKKTLLLALFLCAAQTLRADDVPASEASSHVGETATVCGKVTGVHYAANSKGKPTFINFDKPYPSQDFTVMVWDDDRAGFGNLRRTRPLAAATRNLTLWTMGYIHTLLVERTQPDGTILTLQTFQQKGLYSIPHI